MVQLPTIHEARLCTKALLALTYVKHEYRLWIILPRIEKLAKSDIFRGPHSGSAVIRLEKLVNVTAQDSTYTDILLSGWPQSLRKSKF